MKNLQKVLAAAIVAVVILFAIETASKSFLKYYSEYVKDNDTNLNYNSLGMFKEKEPEELIKEKREKIMFLGTSVVEGRQKGVENNFIALLNQEYSNYVFINAGYDGSNLHMLSNAYINDLMRLKPDVLVLVPLASTLSAYPFSKVDIANTNEPYPVQLLKNGGKKLNLGDGAEVLKVFKLTHNKLREIWTTTGIEKVSWVDHWQTDHTKAMVSEGDEAPIIELLLRIKRELDGRNAKMIVMTLPSRHLLMTATPDDKYGAYLFLEKIAHETGFEYFNTLPDFMVRQEKAANLYTDHLHFSQEGHIAVAKIIAKRLKGAGLLE